MFTIQILILVFVSCVITVHGKGAGQCTKNGVNGICTNASTCRSALQHIESITYQEGGTSIAKKENQCGIVTLEGSEELIIGGMSAKRGEVPWHAGIYTKTTKPYRQICGGSLISSNIIISAAHCFWGELQKQLPAKNYAAAVGKLYRPWNANITKEKDQKSDVKEIHLPVRFQGNEANHQEDIAIVIVTTPFQYTRYVRPVCVDFNTILETKQLRPGNNGTVAGWGLTSEEGDSSQVLKLITLPYVDIKTCISESPFTYRPHITGDKICAGYKGASVAMCKGDSGGGLVFPELLDGQTRYFLRGIVSTAPTSNDNRKCNTDEFTGFTKLRNHEDFIKQIWDIASNSRERRATKTEDDGSFYIEVSYGDDEDVPCKSDKETCCIFSDKPEVPEVKRTGCGWSDPKGVDNNTNNSVAKYGEYPWMCAILETVLVNDNKTGGVSIRDEYLCAGSLIHYSVVLIPAQCLNPVVRDSRLRVRAGVWNAEGINTLHPYQLREVETTEKHEFSDKGTYYYDFALLFLSTPMAPAPNIGVVCLPPQGKPVPAGTKCYITKWAEAKYGMEYRYQDKLKKVEASLLDHGLCERLLRNTFGDNYELHSSMNCARVKARGTDSQADGEGCTNLWSSHLSCIIESKGGRYTQPGIFTWGTSCEENDTPGMYNDISSLRTWIDEKVTAMGYDPKLYTI